MKMRGVALAVLAMFAAGCSTAGERAQEAGVPPTSTTQQRVLDMPEGFHDLGFACHGTTGVYMSGRASYTGLSVAVLANDPECAA